MIITSMALLGLTTLLGAANGPASDPCAATAGAKSYTLLVDEDGRILHCRGGKTTVSEPVSDERVVLQLPPLSGESPYRFRLIDAAAPGKATHAPKLFGRELEVVGELEAVLRDLGASSESVGEALNHLEPSGAPAEGEAHKGAAPAGVRESHVVLQVEAAKAKYLAVATPAFADAVRQLRHDLDETEGFTEQVERACELRGPKVAESLRAIVAAHCDHGGPGSSLQRALRPIEADLAKFVEARKAARDSVFDSALSPSSPEEADAEAGKARSALASATLAAEALVADAAPAAKAAAKFAINLRTLGAAFSYPTNETDGRRMLLGRFPAGGIFQSPEIYQVHLAREPSPLFDLAPEGASEAPSQEVLIDRFQPRPHDWFDLGVAFIYSGGLPDHPELTGRVDAQKLSEIPTTGFAGGILASLEPIGLFCPGSEWGAFIRFPTLIVPFTLDPLTNYFIGGGIGWKDLGALNVGAHVAVTYVPTAGTPYGTQVTTSPANVKNFEQPNGLAAGYFVSLSVDLLGITRLIFGDGQPTVRDVHSGSEMSAVH